MKNANPILDEFNIEFVKLKDGIHAFQYAIGKQFFEAFENTEVLIAEVETQALLEKQQQMMHIDLTMKGTVGVTCGRCLEVIDMPIDTKYRLIINIRDEERVDPEAEYEMIYIKPNAISINVAQAVYETILLDVPMIRNCDSLVIKPCNNEMLEKLEKLKHNGEGESDPRWDILKDLLK